MEIPQEILNGMKLLDEKVPSWRKKINIDELDMEQCRACILGQIFGHFYKGAEELGIDKTGYFEYEAQQLSDKLGFTGTLDDEGWEELTNQWKLALSEEKEQQS